MKHLAISSKDEFFKNFYKKLKLTECEKKTILHHLNGKIGYFKTFKKDKSHIFNSRRKFKKHFKIDESEKFSFQDFISLFHLKRFHFYKLNK